MSPHKGSQVPCFGGLINIFSWQPKIISGDRCYCADKEACLRPILRLVIDKTTQ